MRIFVKAKLRSKQDSVKQIDATHYEVATSKSPIEGKANIAILRALADYFHINRSRIRLISGATSRSKVVQISDSAVS